MRYGLTENTIEKIQNVLRHFPQVEKAIIYGSRAKGNFRAGSDIDLTFLGTELNNSLINKISLELDDLYLPYTFDLSIYQHIDNLDLIDHIDRVGMAFYTSLVR